MTRARRRLNTPAAHFIPEVEDALSARRFPALRARGVIRMLQLIGECLIIFFLVFAFFVTLTARG
jgi:hypothetical protein